MKIGSKLLITYFIVLISALFFSSLFSKLFWQYYFIEEIKTRLYEEGKTISLTLQDIDLQKESSEIDEIIDKDQSIDVYEKKIPYALKIEDKSGSEVFRNLGPLDNSIFKYTRSMPFKGIVKVDVPFATMARETKGTIELYAHIEGAGQASKLTRSAQFLSLIFTGIISVIIVFVLKRYMLKPISALKAEMENFSLNSASDAKLNIKTGDELEELGKSFSNMATKLRQNNEKQKIMLQNISHALKTPLMAIQGHAEAIMEGIVVEDEAKASLEIIDFESQRLKKIIENMIYLYKIENVDENFNFELTDLRTIIDNAVGSVKLTADRNGISITANCPEDFTGLFDSEKLAEAVTNILSNCVRYAETCIRIECLKKESSILIIIEDDGMGFKNNEETYVFDRFYKGEKGDSGIGLSITKAIIEGHKGTIIARNSSIKGAVFEIELPFIKS